MKTNQQTIEWYFLPRDRTDVVSLCAGHRYLAKEGRKKYEPGTGDLGDLGEPPGCCVCMGTTFGTEFEGKPMRDE